MAEKKQAQPFSQSSSNCCLLREPLGIAAFFLDPVGLDRLQTEGDESKRRPGRRPLDGSDAGPMAHVDTESARSADLRHKTGI